MDWKQKALAMKIEGKSWTQIYAEFPNISMSTIRHWVRRQPEYKSTKQEQSSELRQSTELKQDGTIVSEKLITVRDGYDLTPEYILKAHGLDPVMWQMVSYKNNMWNSQRTGGVLQVSFQSKVTAKPIISFNPLTQVEEYFKNKQFSAIPSIKPTRYDPEGEVLEICLPDLHSGLLAWRMETGEDYDVHIAEERFRWCLGDILTRCKNKKFKKIIFVTLGDLLHIDNDMQTTSKGTFQQADGRLAKIFDATLEMLIDGITALVKVAPVDFVYVCGNHDRVVGYTLVRAVEQAFRHNQSVTFDTTPNPQKHKLVGVNLIGWTHGDMPSKHLGTWLQQSARREYGLSKFAEVHAGHIHSQKATEIKQTEEDAGILVRHLPTVCQASYWEHQQGYSQSVKTVMCFVWNEKTGLREMWYSNI
jgi:hypothetical protein